jgi:hypothetical protein
MLASRLRAVVAAAAAILGASAELAPAKRAAPAAVDPVTIRSITCSAPPDAMGFVVARNISSGQELWRQRIYSIRINPARERDVQDVFITSLRAHGGALLITNERGEGFILDPETRHVIRKTKCKIFRSRLRFSTIGCTKALESSPSFLRNAVGSACVSTFRGFPGLQSRIT